MLKILNLYAGIGGNRKLWDGNIEVTAIEIHPDIAKIYQELFPEDKVIITDDSEEPIKHISGVPAYMVHGAVRLETILKFMEEVN